MLQVVTIDGVVSWTQDTKYSINDKLEPTQIGTAMAVSGNTLVVGSKLRNFTHGAVYVHELVNGQWKESAKLYPEDRGNDGNSSGKGLAMLSLFRATH